MSNNNANNPPIYHDNDGNGIYQIFLDGAKWAYNDSGRRVLGAWMEPAGNLLYVVFSDGASTPHTELKSEYECYALNLETEVETLIPKEELNDRAIGAIALQDYSTETKFRSLTVNFNDDTPEQIEAYRQKLQPQDYYAIATDGWIKKPAPAIS